MKKKKKRVTLFSLILKALCASAVLIFIFASGFREYLNYEIDKQSDRYVSYNTEIYKKRINKLEADYSEEEILQLMDNYMKLYGVFEIVFEDPFSSKMVVIHPEYSENCFNSFGITDLSNHKSLLFGFSGEVLPM